MPAALPVMQVNTSTRRERRLSSVLTSSVLRLPGLGYSNQLVLGWTKTRRKSMTSFVIKIFKLDSHRRWDIVQHLQFTAKRIFPYRIRVRTIRSIVWITISWQSYLSAFLSYCWSPSTEMLPPKQHQIM